MATVLGSLILQLSADVGRLQKDMSSAKRTVDKAMTGISKAARAAQTALATLGTGLGTAAIGSSIKQTLEWADNLNNLAERTGLTVEALQALRIRGREVGSEFRQTDTALQRFARRLGDAQSKGAKFFQTVERFGFPTQELRDTETALVEFAKALSKIDDENVKLSAVVDALDSEGRNLYGIFDDLNELGLDGLTDSAIRAGEVVRSDLVAPSSALNAEWDSFTTQVGTSVKSAILGLITPFQLVSQHIKHLQAQTAIFYSELYGLSARIGSSFAELAASLPIVGEQFKGLARDKLEAEQAWAQLGSQAADDLISTAERIEELRARMAGSGEFVGPPLPPGFGAGAEEQPGGDLAAPIGDVVTKTGEATRAFDRLKAEGDALRESLRTPWEVAGDSLERYTMLLNAGAISVETWERANQSAHDTLRSQMTTLTAASEDAGSAITDTMRDVGRSIESSVTNAVQSATLSLESLEDLARSIIGNITSSIIQQQFAGPINTWFSGLFGQAGGGPVRRGQPYLVGEQGPELFVPDGRGSIVPNHQLGGNGPAPVINFNVDAVDARSVQELFVNQRPLVVGMVQEAFTKSGQRGFRR